MKKSKRPLSDNTLSPWRFVKSNKMKTVLLAKQYLDNVKREGNLVSLRDLSLGLRDGLSLETRTTRDILSRLTESKENVYANIDLVMNIISNSVAGHIQTNPRSSAARKARSSAKENLPLNGAKPRIDEEMNERIMGLARRCQEIEKEKHVLRGKLRDISISRDSVQAELTQAKQMVREISHRCSEERKLGRESTKIVNRLEKELKSADERSRNLMSRLRESMKTQKIARERQILVEERMKNVKTRHKQELRRVLREKQQLDRYMSCFFSNIRTLDHLLHITTTHREIAVMKQLMKTRDREREEEFRQYRLRLQHAAASSSSSTNNEEVTSSQVLRGRYSNKEIEELKQLIKKKDRKRIEDVMKLEKEISNWKTTFEERVREVTSDAERRARESKELMEKHREDARSVSKQNQDLKRRFDLKDKELKESKDMLDSWRFQKEDLHRLLRGAELKCKQLEFELQRVQQTALFEMQQRKIAVREKCAEHVENCDLRMKIKELQVNLRKSSSSSDA